MAVLLILAPFGAFATLMLVASTTVSLFAAATIAAGLVARDVLRGRSVKLLTAGSAILFGAVGTYVTLIDTTWSGVAVRVAVDAGLLAIALASIAIRLPFTIQFAREAVDAETRQRPRFVTVNYILTWVWSAAFVLMLAADLVAIYLPSMPLWAGAAIAFAARNSASYFTKWYPKHVRALAAISQNATPTASAS
jgi:hypothetical protein